MGVCPADRALPDGRLPPPIGCPPGWASAPPDQTALPSVPCARPPVPVPTKKGDPVGSPFDSGTDQKNQLKVIVDDPYLYRSSFSFAAS